MADPVPGPGLDPGFIEPNLTPEEQGFGEQGKGIPTGNFPDPSGPHQLPKETADAADPDFPVYSPSMNEILAETAAPTPLEGENEGTQYPPALHAFEDWNTHTWPADLAGKRTTVPIHEYTEMRGAAALYQAPFGLSDVPKPAYELARLTQREPDDPIPLGISPICDDTLSKDVRLDAAAIWYNSQIAGRQ